MNLRWLIRDYIPPELDVPRAKRREIRREMSLRVGRDLRSLRGWREVLQYFIIAIICMFGYVYLLNNVDTTNWPVVVQLLAMAVIPLGIYVLVMLICRTRHEKVTYEVLREHGFFICTNCGYRLDVLPDTADRCPECGTDTGETESS